MLAKTHMLCAVAVAMPATVVLEKNQIVLFLISIIIGSLFPDLDEPNSYLSRRVKIISYFISMFTKHRGLTHTILVALILFALLYLSIYIKIIDFLFMSYGFLLGYIVHIMSDMATVEGGIALFYPFLKKRFYLTPKFLRFKTGGIVERVLVIPATTMIVMVEGYFLLMQRIL